MFDAGYRILTVWTTETTQVKEPYNFHPILLYFRFRGTHYLVSQRSLTTLDTISLLKSALDEKEFSWLKRSAAVEEYISLRSQWDAISPSLPRILPLIWMKSIQSLARLKKEERGPLYGD